MKLILINEIEEGMILGKSLYDENSTLLLGAGYRFDSRIIKTLTSLGYSFLYVMEEGTETVIPEDIISDEIAMMAKAKLQKKSEEIKRTLMLRDMNMKKFSALISSGYLRQVDITGDLSKVVTNILEDILADGAEFVGAMMSKSENNYKMEHALDCTVLAILIGKKFGFNTNELKTLALGTYLHDFGKIVLDKMKNTSQPQMQADIIKEHPVYGYLMVKGSKGTLELVSQIILQHHENQDGSGYPFGLVGLNSPPDSDIERIKRKNIMRFAEICSVVDRYDNLLMNPFDRNNMTPINAIRKMISESGTIYNKYIVRALVSIIAIYPVGVCVKITDYSDKSIIGYSGIVAEINDENINRPKVILFKDRADEKIEPIKIDTLETGKIRMDICF